MLLTLALLSSSASAVEVFVETSAELQSALNAAPSSGPPSAYQVWLLPGTYDMTYNDLNGQVVSLLAVVPGRSTVRGNVGTTTRMFRIRGDARFEATDLVFDGGGAQIFEVANDATAEFTRSLFQNAGSSADNRGGVGTVNSNGGATIVASRLEAASTGAQGGLLRVQKGAFILRDSWLEGGYAEEEGGCLYAANGTVLVEDTTFLDCGSAALVAPTNPTETGGAVYLEDDVTSATFTRVVVDGARSFGEGAGIWSATGLTLRDSLVCRAQSADYTGAGVFTTNGTNRDVLVERTLFMGNRSPTNNGHWGTVLRLEGDGDHEVTLRELAVIGNEGAGAPTLWSGLLDSDASVLLTNSLLAYNVPSNLVDAWADANASHALTNSSGWPDPPSGSGFSTANVASVNPGFANPGTNSCDVVSVVPTAGVLGAFVAGGLEDVDLDGSFVPRDCNDADASIHPGAGDTTCDGVDDDCDGQTDEDAVLSVFYFDEDGDGQGSSTVVMACRTGPHVADNAFDCDDTDAVDRASIRWLDVDGDGFGGGAAVGYCAQSPPLGWVEVGGDCDDLEDTVFPEADERCDGLDNDCDLEVDEGAPPATWWADGDGDGYGRGAEYVGCTPPANHILKTPGDLVDCDDEAAQVFPGAVEMCNALDDDCDDLVDDGAMLAFWNDVDQDGVGAGQRVEACVAPPSHVPLQGPADCDDNNALVFPGATEVCNHVDDDCDHDVDEGVLEAFAPDLDGDGFGAGVVTEACVSPAGSVPLSIGVDCDDTTALRAPNRVEACDGLDNDCDVHVDEGLLFRDIVIDLDADGFGAVDSLTSNTCAMPAGAITNPGLPWDCDDDEFFANPGVEEVCDQIDNDCDGLVDEDGQPALWYADIDGDGVGGDRVPPTESCVPIDGLTRVAGDCNDDDASVFPGASDSQCDGIDDNCDGVPDDEAPLIAGYADLDEDGFAGGDLLDLQCPLFAAAEDCDDDDPLVNPSAFEVCGPVDTDCDGQIGDVQLACDEAITPPLVLPPPASGCTCDATATPRWFTWLQRRR